MSVLSKFLDNSELVAYITDIRLQVGSVPWVNINRKWSPHPVLKEPVTQDELEGFIKEAQSINDEQDLALEGRELDFAFSAELSDGAVHRFRGHESRNYQGMAIDVRVLRASCQTISELGFKKKLVDSFFAKKTGLVLIGGPTGSGKSTTLAALVSEYAQRNPGCHIVSLEDPIEYIFRFPNSLTSQKHIPKHVESFERGIFEAKREKPDVIVIGEIRTKEAMRGALEASGSGHLVMATTFADRIPQVITAVRDAYSMDEQESVLTKLAYLMRGVICQTLVSSQNVDSRGYGMPALIYEALCNDESWVNNVLRKGNLANLDMKTMDVGGESVSWEARIAELEQRKEISSVTADFLRRK
jgi:twitching motility protein PilT